MKTLKLMGVALLTAMICACSGNKGKDQVGQEPIDSAQASAVDTTTKADTIAQVNATEDVATKLDKEEMKTVVKKFFATYFGGNVKPLLSTSYRKQGVPDIGFGGDLGYEDGSLKITSADPESGVVKAKATGSCPDEESESGERIFTADYQFYIVKEDGKCVIDKIKYSGFDF